MIIPVRCFSCGKAVSQYYDAYKKKVEEGQTKEQALDELNLNRQCCRKTVYAHVPLMKDVMKYQI